MKKAEIERKFDEIVAFAEYVAELVFEDIVSSFEILDNEQLALRAFFTYEHTNF